jgi:hypothetical protein
MAIKRPLVLYSDTGSLEVLRTTDTLPNSGANTTRHDYVAPYSYIGTALTGSAEASAVWTIKRINVAADGTTSVQSVSAVTWTGRVGHTYT